MLWSLPFPSAILKAVCVILTLAIIIVIAIARSAPPTARYSGISPVLIIIILVDYLSTIQWSNGQEVSQLALLATWRLNLCPEIVATVPREMLAGAFNLTQSWLSVAWSYQLDPWSLGGCPTFNCSFRCRLCQSFAPYMSGRLPTNPDKTHSCSCAVATLVGILKSDDLWLYQERLYLKTGPMPSHPWRRKHYISIWVHGCFQEEYLDTVPIQ